MPAWKHATRIRRVRTKRPSLEKSGTPLTEQHTVPQLVDRVFEVETAQQWIGSDLGSAQNVAAAIRLDLTEREQLADTPIDIAPHPSMYRLQQSIDRRNSSYGHR